MRGRGGLFQKAPKSSLIPWNGSKALIDFPGQPQKMLSAAKKAFSACPGPMNRAPGAFDELRKFATCAVII